LPSIPQHRGGRLCLQLTENTHRVAGETAVRFFAGRYCVI
jgi:hypothetical protein